MSCNCMARSMAVPRRNWPKLPLIATLSDMPRAPQIPLIDPTRCTGCGRCIAACPLPLIAFRTIEWRKFAVLQDEANCTGCRRCEARCPVGAITMTTGDIAMPSQPALANAG
ncbi:ferredoxin family protein [Rhodoferax sp. GW822-FHT02A01]|uniref:4Fe-4S dicluster domain-containing protein n=1 Tax=Rhodoferax sp. GW822-FHT02A01 TaxID=3141537 RepID=UPI00315C8266